MIKRFFGWGYFVYSRSKGKSIFFKVAGNRRMVLSNEEKHMRGYYCFVGNGAIELNAAVKLCQVSDAVVFKDKRSIISIAHSIKALKHMKKHAECESDSSLKLYFSKKFVYAGARNKITILQMFKEQLQSEEVDNIVSRINNLSESFTRIKALKSLDKLRGFEGEVTHLYFSAFSTALMDKYGFPGRVKFPPKDPINAALSYLYVRLSSICTEILLNVGLSPKIGFLHETGRNRNSLALDIVEEFRQPVVDRIVFSLALDGILDKEKHFINESGRVLLNKRGKKLINKSFALVMREYSSIIEEQANNLKEAILYGSKYEPYIMRWEDVSVL